MKTPGHERIIIRIILTALAAFSIFCIFWTPYDQLKLLRPIPANAVLVSSHYNLGSQLESMATNIFLKAFFDSNAVIIKKMRENHYAARILASRLIIMAYVPDFNQFATRSAWSSNPALVISSWVGGWSTIFRWVLWIRPSRDIMPLGEYNGHRLWTFKKPFSFSGAANFFSFAIDEGVFIGCLSSDRNDITHLMKIYDGQSRSILSEAQCRFVEKTPTAGRIWMRFDMPYSPQKQSIFAIGSLDVLQNDYLAATIRFEPDMHLNDYIGQNQDLAEIWKKYACSPSVVALLPSDMATNGLNGLIAPAWASAVKPILAPLSGTNNVCLLTVLKGDYGGKFGKEPFRITVPTILLAVSGSRQEQTKAAVLELLDLINAKHRFGLILNSAGPSAGQCPVFSIESTSGAFFKLLPVEDQPAFAFYNDWFLLASNGAGLRKLLLNFQSQTIVPADDGNNNWLKRADSRRKKAFIWIDPDEGGKTLRFALTASIMMLDVDSQHWPKQNTIKILKAARSWLEDISHLKNCMAWMESEDGKTVVRLEIGRRKTEERSQKPGIRIQ